MLQRLFDLKAHGTTVRTEILAGLTTFVTMAYIVVVNPLILGDAGMPVAGVAVATCVAAGFGSILMGLLSNYPLALAPGMGLNAYFTYTVVKGMGLPWQTALGCVFLSGCAFALLTAAGVRKIIISALPRSLFSAVGGGIGLFIAFIGLKDAGVVVADPGTTVGLGHLTTPTAAVSLLGLLIIAALQSRGVRGYMLIGILITAVVAWSVGLSHFTPGHFTLHDLGSTAFKLDIPAALSLKGGIGLSVLEIVFVFLFVDMFDNVGTLVAVTRRAGLVAADGTIPRLNRILAADSASMFVGALAGTSPVTSYIESAAGVAAARSDGADQRGGGAAVPGDPGVCAGRAGDTGRGHCAGIDPGRCADDGRAGRDRMDGSGAGHPGVPDRGDHAADLLDHQRPGVRHHQLRVAEADPRPGATRGLAGVPAGGTVRGALHLPVLISLKAASGRPG